MINNPIIISTFYIVLGVIVYLVLGRIRKRTLRNMYREGQSKSKSELRDLNLVENFYCVMRKDGGASSGFNQSTNKPRNINDVN